MSLATLRKVSDEGVLFQSHLDGAKLHFTPEDVVGRQHRLGVDVLMPLDELVPAGAAPAVVGAAMRRTTDWAWRSSRVPIRPDRHLFAIVQGGFDPALRREHATQLAAGGFPGYAVGGLSVGEERGLTRDVAAVTAAALPVDRPRYLMGVGLPQDLLRLVGMGYDLFDCVLPTRNGRNAMLLHRGRAAEHAPRPAHRATTSRSIRPAAARSAAACRAAYLRHLCVAGEMLGAQLASLHNVHFYLDLMRQARAPRRGGRLCRLGDGACRGDGPRGGCMIDVAWAQGAAGAAAARRSGFSCCPSPGIFAVFYFLLIRPQQQKANEHTAMLANLKKNDEVITSGGLYGRVIQRQRRRGHPRDRAQRAGAGRAARRSPASSTVAQGVAGREATNDKEKDKAK